MPKNKKRSIRRAAEAITGAMELPIGAFTKNAKIELSSNREAVIDGCCGILEYSDEQIRVNIGSLVVKFKGRNLLLRSLGRNEAVITGFIISVDFGN